MRLILVLFLTLLLWIPDSHARAYLIVHTGISKDGQNPTYIATLTPQRDSRSGSLFIRKLRHYPLDPPITLIKLTHGTHRLSHFDYSRKTEGDNDTLHFPGGIEFNAKKDQIYYLGTSSFRRSELTMQAIREAVLLTCSSLGDQLPAEARFHFLRFIDEARAVKARCVEIQREDLPGAKDEPQ